MSKGRYYPKGQKARRASADPREMVKQIEQMQRLLEETQEALENESVEYSAGGGAVKVTANGRRKITGIKIDPEAVNPEDVEMLEDLILAAVNGALEESEKMEKERIEGVTGGMPFSGLI